VVVDDTPFESIHNIVEELGMSDKISVFAEWNKDMFQSKEHGNWRTEYHAHLWNATDRAIAACSPKTEWVVITNGDNLYGKGFLKSVLKRSASTEIDLIAFDFYSRFNRPTMPPCERFCPQYNPGNMCKENLLRWCQTDLGSIAFRYRRFIQEGRSFARVNSTSYGLENANNDGLLIQNLVNDGWKYAKATNTCLFEHAPTIQMCASKGHVWDDTHVHTGGDCIPASDANAKLATDATLEILEIPVIHGDNFENEYFGVQSRSLLQTKCIRRKNYYSKEQVAILNRAFGERCTHPADLDAFRSLIAKHQIKSRKLSTNLQALSRWLPRLISWE
jgi:hypothetical protein